MKNVVFLGSKKIGLDCLKYLVDQQDSLGYKILGVLTNARGEEIRQYCQTRQIPIIPDLSSYADLQERVDIAISVQYHQILKKPHIEKAREITVNLHMAPLPEFRGCNQFSFAIIRDKKEFGTTIHILEEGIDSGAILFESRFPIDSDIWVSDLYEKTFEESINLFKANLENLIRGSYKPVPQEALLEDRGSEIHYRKEIEEIKNLDLDWPAEKISRHIRATYFPGFEPPYFLVNEQKVHIKVEDD